MPGGPRYPAPVAKARPIPGLHTGDAYAAVAVRVVEVRASELFEHSIGVLDTGDIERLHAMRVATRRLRAALEVFAPCFERQAYKRALRAVKPLADALGERRDRDVAIAELGQFAAALGPVERPGLASLVARLSEEQVRANIELEPRLSAGQLAELRTMLTELIASARR